MELAIVRTQRANSQNSPCSNLAGLLADMGLHVLVINADIQASLRNTKLEKNREGTDE